MSDDGFLHNGYSLGLFKTAGTNELEPGNVWRLGGFRRDLVPFRARLVTLSSIARLIANPLLGPVRVSSFFSSSGTYTIWRTRLLRGPKLHP